MKQELTAKATNEIASVTDQVLISHLDALGLTSKLNDGEKNTFLSIAKAFNLNPFKREIHISKYGENLSIITGYEVYIKRAERTGQLDGWNATTSGTIEGGDLKATVTIYRKDRTHPFIWEALYDECVQKTREGKVTKFWEKAAFMTKKVAISQGFRLCFSDELAGMPYTADEMPDQPQQTEDASHVLVLPNITDKMFGQLIKKLEAGELDAIEKVQKLYTLSDAQLDTAKGTKKVEPKPLEITGNEQNS